MLLQLWTYHHLSRSFLFVNPLRTIFLAFFKFSEGPLTNTWNVQLHWQSSHGSCRVTGISLHIWVPQCSCSDPSWGTWTWRRTFVVALSLLFFNTWWLDIDFGIKLISHSIACKFNYVGIRLHLHIHMCSSHKPYNDLRVPLLF